MPNEKDNNESIQQELHATRKVGLPRYFEMVGRDLWAFYRAGFLCAVGFLPGAVLLWFGLMGGAALYSLLGGLLAGLVGAPFVSGMIDTVLRSLRDEPGFWWATYRRAWKRNVKASLLPGAVCGLLLAMEIFTAFHLDISQSVVPAVAVLVALILLAGIAQYIYAQVALVEIGFGGLLKNALMLFLGYLPRSALGVLWQGIYWAAVALFWPVSSFAVILCSLWLPCLLNLMAIYPALDKSFDLEKTIKAMRDAQLNSENEDK